MFEPACPMPLPVTSPWEEQEEQERRTRHPEILRRRTRRRTREEEQDTQKFWPRVLTRSGNKEEQRKNKTPRRRTRHPEILAEGVDSFPSTCILIARHLTGYSFRALCHARLCPKRNRR